MTERIHAGVRPAAGGRPGQTPMLDAASARAVGTALDDMRLRLGPRPDERLAGAADRLLAAVAEFVDLARAVEVQLRGLTSARSGDDAPPAPGAANLPNS